VSTLVKTQLYCRHCGGNVLDLGAGLQCLLCSRPYNPEVVTKRQISAQSGGVSTYLRYGREGMRERGKRGGRPRLQTIDEVRQQSAPKTIKEYEGGKLPTSLVKLKELYRLQEKVEA